MTVEHELPRGRLIERLSAPALGRLGIEPRQFWLLVDTLRTLSLRQEIPHLGGRENSMRFAMIFLFIAFSLFAAMMVFSDMSTDLYLFIFAAITAFQIAVALLPEIAANLVNPSEVTVLAHQPISGATWTFAKITHLLRVIVYMVIALNGAPAFFGLLLLHSTDRQMVGYPIMHLAITFGIGIIVGLACCSIFGWAIRFTPPKRLQAIAAVIQLVPMVLMIGFMTWGRLFVETASMRYADLVTNPWSMLETTLGLSSTSLVAVLVLLSIWALVFGLRALSSNRLIRSHDQDIDSRRKANSWELDIRSLISARLANQVRRSGFVYMSIIMMRDWQFWRNLFAVSIGASCGLGYALVRGWDGTPFNSGFNTVHLFPHLLGLTTLLGCRFLAYGNDYKCAWLFTTMPRHFVDPFAQGVTIFLLSFVVGLPHLASLLTFVWFWPFIDLALFVTFSALVTSIYLLIGLGYIEGIPFGRQYDPEKIMLSFFFFLIWGLGMAATFGIQLLLFLSYYAVIGAILVLSITAIILAKSSLSQFATDIKVHLDELAVQ